MRSSIGAAQLTRFNFASLDLTHVDDRRDVVDLCLTPRPRNTRARFCNRWGPHRFERLGTVFLAPRGEALQYRTDGGTQLSIVCQFEDEQIRDWLQASVWTGRQLEAGLDISHAAVTTLLRRLADELRAPGFAAQTMGESLMVQIAIEIARFGRTIDANTVTGGLAAWQLRRIEEQIAELREPPTLVELAKVCNLSVRHLSRAFRASRGCSIGDHIARSRIELAKRLLASDESIKSIAISMGFSSASYFSHAFRRATGQTPRGYRSARAWR